MCDLRDELHGASCNTPVIYARPVFERSASAGVGSLPAPEASGMDPMDVIAGRRDAGVLETDRQAGRGGGEVPRQVYVSIFTFHHGSDCALSRSHRSDI